MCVCLQRGQSVRGGGEDRPRCCRILSAARQDGKYVNFCEGEIKRERESERESEVDVITTAWDI